MTMYEPDRTGGPRWEFGVAGERLKLYLNGNKFWKDTRNHGRGERTCVRWEKMSSRCCQFTTEEAMSTLRLRSVLDNKAAEIQTTSGVESETLSQ